MSPALAPAIPNETLPRAGGQRPSSFDELAEKSDIVLKEKLDVAYRLCEALDEITAINQLYQKRRAECESEKRLLNLEIDKLLVQVTEFSTENEKRGAVSGGVQSLLDTQERLIREEFGKKLRSSRSKLSGNAKDIPSKLAK